MKRVNLGNMFEGIYIIFVNVIKYQFVFQEYFYIQGYIDRFQMSFQLYREID